MDTAEMLGRQGREDLAATLKRGVQASTLCDAVYNAARQFSATALVRCDDEDAVVRAVRFATERKLKVSAVSGGHDLWSRGMSADAMVLDMRGMRNINISQDEAAATFGGGALTSELVAALPRGRAAAVGSISVVGLVGLITGGGYGPLLSRFGLACDNILSARVVLADGSIAIAESGGDEDLLWALKGGGSGFGIVTAMTVALHPLPRILHGKLRVSLKRAAAALAFADELTREHPKSLGLPMGLAMPPDGARSLMLSPAWTGQHEQGEALFDRMADETGGEWGARDWKEFPGLFDLRAEAAWPKGERYSYGSRNVARMDVPTIEALVASAADIPMGTAAIAINDFHGVAADVPPGATAFPLREPHRMLVIGGWAKDNDRAVLEEWFDRTMARISAVAMLGGYVNLLAPDEDDRVAAFYGEAAARLISIKRRVDPNDIFAFGIGRLAE